MPVRTTLPRLAAMGIALCLILTTLSVIASCRSRRPPITPASIITLTNWKLQLPTASPGSSTPSEVRQPELGWYSSSYFHARGTDGVAFQVMAGGVRTEGANYARTELREMTDGGSQPASWSTSSGRHVMTIRQAVTVLPPVHPAMVVGQVHGTSHYLVLIRLDGQRLYVKANDQNQGDLDTNYLLGTPFTVRIEASQSHILVWYNGQLKVDLTVTEDTCYFKAGAYLQTNPERGERSEAVGEVVVSDLKVEHL